ncbi:MAG: ABC transporter ATP-binding protein [Planctomycetota bacterium]
MGDDVTDTSERTSFPAVERELIRLDGARKDYTVGDHVVHALDGITLSLAAGTFTAIMGSSGSGKSTMLNVLGCLDRPTAGTYTLDKEAVSELNDERLSDIRLHKLGFVFQSFHLIPQLTVRENIELPLYYQGTDKDESAKRAEMLAERVGLGERLDHRPSELSGGQMQRVAIARALSNEPRLLLADEPTGNLDSATTDQIMSLLTELNGQGVTIVMVTHEPDIAQHCPTHLHMRDGLVQRYSGPGLRVLGLDPEDLDARYTPRINDSRRPTATPAAADAPASSETDAHQTAETNA